MQSETPGQSLSECRTVWFPAAICQLCLDHMALRSADRAFPAGRCPDSPAAPHHDPFPAFRLYPRLHQRLLLWSEKSRHPGHFTDSGTGHPCRSVWLVADIQMQRGQLVTPQIAVLGILFGELASSLYSVTMICFFSERTENKKTVPNPSVPPSSIRLTKIAKDLCSMAVPLTCSRILLSLCQSAEALLIPIKLRDLVIQTVMP